MTRAQTDVRQGWRRWVKPGAAAPRKGVRFHRQAYLFVAPAMIFYIVFLIWPLLQSLWLSLYHWDGITLASWAGLDNFIKVLEDGAFWESLRHSLIFIVFYAILPTVLSLGVIGVISRVQVHGLTFFRAALFVPYILSTVVVAITWRWIYQLDGPLNAVLKVLGLEGIVRAWLGDFGSALPAVGLIGTWVMFGLAFVLFISGLQSIPRELYEAAEIDGAGFIREFFAVTLPGLRGQIRVALVLMVTAALRNFDIVWNATSGGPGTSTTVPSYFIYQGAFRLHEVGRSSAIAVVMTVVILVIVGVLNAVMMEKSDRRQKRRSMS